MPLIPLSATTCTYLCLGCLKFAPSSCKFSDVEEDTSSPSDAPDEGDAAFISLSSTSCSLFPSDFVHVDIAGHSKCTQ